MQDLHHVMRKLMSSLYDCGKGASSQAGASKSKRQPKETLSSMIRNQKPPEFRQQVLFSPIVEVVDLPTDKQRELQTAVAELLLNALTDDDPIDSGETDDASQAHA
jgi:hypothetical protein